MGFGLKISVGKTDELSEVKAKDNSVEKIAFLNILQGIISRLANTASVIKVASVTASSAFLAFSINKDINFHWWMFLPTAIVFWAFHAYFLQQERAFVKIYNDVAKIDRLEEVDFSIRKEKLDQFREPYVHILIRKTVVLFHFLVCAAFVLVYFYSKKAIDVC